jgi:signal transduction histidine kinase
MKRGQLGFPLRCKDSSWCFWAEFLMPVLMPLRARSRQLLLLILVFGGVLNVHAKELLAVDSNINLAGIVEIYVDRTGKATFSEVTAPENRDRFSRPEPHQSDLNFGFSSAAYWLKFTLSRAQDAPETWILEIPYLGLDSITLYEPDRDPQLTGGLQAVNERPIFTRFYTLPVSVSAQPQTYYLRVQSSYTVTIPLKLYRVDTFSKTRLTDTLIQSLYFGGLLSLFFYNLVLFVLIRDRRYFLYCCFTLFIGLAIFSGNGFSRLYLWPDSPEFDRISQSFFFALTGTFGLLFTKAFLKTRSRAPIAHGIFVFLASCNFLIASALLASLAWPLPLTTLFALQFAFGLATSIMALLVSIRLALAGYRLATYFVLSWGMLSIGGVVAGLRGFELLPSNTLTLYAIQIGSGFEALLFSFALAHRIRTDRNRHEQSQREILAARELLVQTLRESEVRLEKLVSERTEKLQQLLVSEKKIREQYVRFGAMIAHEFRNPLSIIEVQNTLIELQPDAAQTTTLKRVGVIRSAVNRLALLFDQWLASDRLNQAFTEITPLPIDLIQLLEELVVTSRTYHTDHQISLSLNQSSMVVPADYHLLRIAVLNLIDNACKYSPKGSGVVLGVVTSEESVGLFVRDQGRGIPEKKQHEVFDAYVRLSTDDQSRGVGLGLALVKQVAQLHKGSVTVESEVDKGSTFTIWLPIPSHRWGHDIDAP